MFYYEIEVIYSLRVGIYESLFKENHPAFVEVKFA